jgi:hypothetical protein
MDAAAVDAVIILQLAAQAFQDGGRGEDAASH